MDFMEALTTEISRRQKSIDYSYRKDTNTSIDYRSIDRVLDSYPQLVAPDYRGWHVKQINRIGADKYIELAERALKYGKHPQKLFSDMLRKY